MKRRKRALRDWLAAERGTDDRAAELALFRLFHALPAPVPGRAFVARTLERAGIAGSKRARKAGPLFKLGVAAGLALAASSMLLIPGLLAFIVKSGGQAGGFFIGLITGLFQRLAHGLAVWEALLSAARIVAEALSSPAVLTALGLSLLVSLAAFQALSRLLSFERRMSHV